MQEGCLKVQQGCLGMQQGCLKVLEGYLDLRQQKCKAGIPWFSKGWAFGMCNGMLWGMEQRLTLHE
eukprot:scaffold299976_cov19-Tisochrysis_lutea.AAC.1